MSSEWPTVPIGSLCIGIFDGPHATPKKTEAGPVFLGISSLRRGQLDRAAFEFLSEDDFQQWTRRVVPQAGDVVFSYETRLGEVALIPPDLRCCLGRRMALMRIDRTKALPEFVVYAFLAPAFQDVIRARTIHGSTVDRLPLTDFGTFPITAPPLHVQREVVESLRALDDRIALLRETNATLEAIAQALFKSWFVDFDPVRAKSQGQAPAGMDEATAALFPDSFEESALGQVPEGWCASRIEEVAARIGMGPFGSNIKVSTFVEEGMPVLNGSNVQGALLQDGDFRYITNEHAGRLRNSCVRAGDIVLTHRGTLGQVALVPKSSRFDEYVLSQSQFFLRCDSRVMQPEWMLYFLRSPGGQHLLLANASQVGVPSIARPSTYLKSMPLVLPPSALVNRFAEVASASHGAITGNRQRIHTLATLRDTLLPRLISGQLRLPEAIAAPEEFLS